MAAPIVENSYYEHDRHGTVRVVSVDATTVAFEIVDRHHHFPGGHRVLQGQYEAVSEFRAATQPADIDVVVEPATLNSTSTNP